MAKEEGKCALSLTGIATLTVWGQDEEKEG